MISFIDAVDEIFSVALMFLFSGFFIYYIIATIYTKLKEKFYKSER